MRVTYGTLKEADPAPYMTPGVGRASEGRDFVPLLDSVIFFANQSEANITLRVLDDEDPERDESVFVKTDHYMIKFTVGSKEVRSSVERWNTNKADWEKFKEKMGEKIKYSMDDQISDQDQLYIRIKEDIISAANETIPKIRANGKHKSWWDEELNNLYKAMKKNFWKWQSREA